jgi:hypothetical protein
MLLASNVEKGKVERKRSLYIRGWWMMVEFYANANKIIKFISSYAITFSISCAISPPLPLHRSLSQIQNVSCFNILCNATDALMFFLLLLLLQYNFAVDSTHAIELD